MRMVKFIGLMMLAGFFGVYAMVLGVKGVENYNQLLLCTLFGMAAFVLA